MLTNHQLTEFGRLTVKLARDEVNRGGLPFSAVIVDSNGECLSFGFNQVSAQHDCTAHAEIQAIRAASKRLGRSDLTGTTLFASGEPCGLCYVAIRLAKISNIVVLQDRNEVKELGFDYLWTYEMESDKPHRLTVEKLSDELRSAPFKQCKRNLADIGL